MDAKARLVGAIALPRPYCVEMRGAVQFQGRHYCVRRSLRDLGCVPEIAPKPRGFLVTASQNVSVDCRRDVRAGVAKAGTNRSEFHPSGQQV